MDTLSRLSNRLDSFAERERFRSDLRARAGSEYSDESALYFLQFLQTSVTIATYILTSSAGVNASEGKLRFAYCLFALWESPDFNEGSDIPEHDSLLRWFEQATVTTAAFIGFSGRDGVASPERNAILEEAHRHTDHLRLGSNDGRARELLSLAKDMWLSTRFDPIADTKRSTRVWAALEALTVVGVPTSPLSHVASRSVAVDRLGKLVADGAEPLSEAYLKRSDLHKNTTLYSSATYPRSTSDDFMSGTRRLSTSSTGHPADGDDSALFEVWYGTNRRAQTTTDGVVTGYTNGRDSTGTIHLGTCLVNIPKSHKFGSVGIPLWQALWSPGFKDGKLSVGAIEQLHSESDFLASIAKAFEKTAEPSVLVYVHGYNTSFKQAAVRAAQLGYDLKAKGITAFYSWPSSAQPLAYFPDQDRADASEAQFADFLSTLVLKSDASRVDLIVHSMGNRLLARSIFRLANGSARDRIQFGTIVLAAPDIDVDLFTELAAVYPTLSSKTSMYVSARDGALALAKSLQDSERAGFTPPVTVLAGIDTIEVTSIDLSLLGHGYYAAAAPVLYDMKALIDGAKEPVNRLRLRSRVGATGEYWLLSP